MVVPGLVGSTRCGAAPDEGDLMATVKHLLDRRFNGYMGIKVPHELDDLVESVVAGYGSTLA
ncbi:hypothetical protein A6A25_38210 [Saccharothrix sp. CB00851]|nr:hypothetical protein A6A25_38210 [Saccharothrix sp. CB00851]